MSGDIVIISIYNYVDKVMHVEVFHHFSFPPPPKKKNTDWIRPLILEYLIWLSHEKGKKIYFL